MSPVITLTTDFGNMDAYVAAMKGVILSINPSVTIVDICHSIEPQNIAQAALMLNSASSYFPPGSIHIAVVDPGVGSKRRAVILETPRGLFLAPDNGILSYVIEGFLSEGISAQNKPCQKELPSGLRAIVLTNPRYWRSPVSSTFHGRNIFAPVAAHLSLDMPPTEFGEETNSLLTFPIPHPMFTSEGGLVGHIIYIDHFGNLITDIKDQDLPKEDISIDVSSHRIHGLSSSYARGEGLLALIGSSSNLEIAMKNGNAARLLRAHMGDEVKIIKKRPKS